METLLMVLSLALSFLVGLLVKDYFPSYVRKKAENLATKEDIAGITRKVEEVKSAIEIEKELEKQFLGKKQKFLMKFFDEITEFYYEKLGINFGDFPSDQGQSLFEYQSEFYKLVATILKSYQRLVIFFPPNSELLGYANLLTSCVIESRRTMKDHFGKIKITAINEQIALSGNDQDEKLKAVNMADEANAIFWKEMKPSVERFRENYRHFLSELNEHLKPKV